MGNYSFTIHKEAIFTPVPNIFIEEYMPSADGNFVKVYLAGLLEALNPDGANTPSLPDKLGLIESDIIKAWEYWESKGLVKFTKPVSGSMAVEFLTVSSTYASKDIPGPIYGHTSESMLLKMEDPMVKDMFESIEKLLARTLSSKEFSMYINWLDDYGFSPEVVILLIEYCKSKGKIDSRYIEKVAIGWHDASVSTIEDAQRHITQHEDKYNRYRLVLDFLGLKENDLMKPQQEFLDKWFDTWGFSLEVVLEACKICSLRINEPKFSYIDGILSNWHKKGVTDIKDIESMDNKKKNKNVKFKAPVNSFNSYDQRTYDIKELEKKLLGRDEEVDDAK